MEGTTFLNPSLYECVSLFVLAGVLFWMLRRRLTPSVVGGTFLLAYAVQRFAWDAMRVNDGKFEIVGRVKADAAIGPDTCARF